MGVRNGEDPDDGALVGGGSENGSLNVQNHTGQRRSMSFHDIDGLEFDCVEYQYLARRWRHMGTAGWSV